MKKLLLIALTIINVNYLFADSSPFNFIVDWNGTGTHRTIQSAIDDCPDDERSIIFIKNGVYEEQVSIGTYKSTGREESRQLISLIGESVDGVVITADNSRTSENGLSWYDVVTFLIYAKDFYAENITFENKGREGQAEAVYTGRDRNTFKNCRLLGSQDTYRAQGGARAYFWNSFIEGGVDFIYAGGSPVFFDSCQINSMKNGYIVAPEDAQKSVPRANTEGNLFVRTSFFFRNCLLTANDDVADNSCYLGRPWKANSGVYFLNCRMGNHIKPEGWSEWSGSETTASFGEYQSMDSEGNLLDVSKRVDWSYQLLKEDVDQFMTARYMYDFANSSDPYDPLSICRVFQPANFNFNKESGELSWDAVEGAIGYLLYKDGEFLAATTETSYVVSDADEISEYSIKTMSEIGSLSKALKVGEEPEADPEPKAEPEPAPNSIATSDLSDTSIQVNDRLITWSKIAEAKLYNLSGELVINGSGESMEIPNSIPGGLYIIHLSVDNSSVVQKIMVK